jgi:hypothetical protein
MVGVKSGACTAKLMRDGWCGGCGDAGLGDGLAEHHHRCC